MESVEHIYVEGRRILKLIDTMFSLILLENNPLNPEEISMDVLFEELKILFKFRLEERFIRLVYERETEENLQ